MQVSLCKGHHVGCYQQKTVVAASFVCMLHLVLQIPHAVLVGELLVTGAALWQNAALKATHVEEQVGVVFAVDGHKAVLPLDRSD